MEHEKPLGEHCRACGAAGKHGRSQWFATIEDACGAAAVIRSARRVSDRQPWRRLRGAGNGGACKADTPTRTERDDPVVISAQRVVSE